ncbi:Uncharacterized protein YR821_2583 [Yersinia ruckeri]|uniref:Uncharacterized protein n=1 Tax=Yersinia ruckeri TaxID=29486 RepID=A0A0A8VLC4_YERRU|nr:hypothetical protein yruck0001_6380 [Yersinia ruckeri ATCC 29473]QTD77501.1 Uncharacterized protein YR821_2583 [Yersinia ruckeri]CEK28411.1 hypothetical protein CSF007_13395 [Yersinia ruckeri]
MINTTGWLKSSYFWQYLAEINQASCRLNHYRWVYVVDI